MRWFYCYLANIRKDFESIMKTKYEFTHEDTVGVYGVWYRDEVLDEYARKFKIFDDFVEPAFLVIEGDEKHINDCIETARKSIKNGKPFFYNAPEYIQKRMIKERENLENGVRY